MSQESDIEIVQPTTEISKEIRAVSRDTVHRICSGQVVLNLAIAVKELVENAIDAGATSIEVRLKEYGSELVEVIDNGTGVEEHNFAALTLKHHTSKIREFSDLSFVSTLGFRGEALSSLCALSDLSIVTRHKVAEHATKIEYDRNGYIKSKIPCARQIGTTVSLTNLFSSLPVRHKDFIKNLKREFSKMCQLLYAYCLIEEGIRIHCTNQTKKGPRTTVVSTQGSKSIKDNITCIFGTKQMDSLVQLSMQNPDEKILEDFSVKMLPGELLPFTFQGYISKCTHGCGRSTNDRQFFYINSRPCEPTKMIKIANEVYRNFNGNQYPFVFLNIIVEQSQVDVNVTPDKRQIFIEKEKLLLATVKTSLLETFKEFPSTFKMQNINIKNETMTNNSENQIISNVLKKFSKTGEQILNQNRGVKRNTEPKPKGIMAYIYEKRLKISEDFSQDLSADSASEDEGKQVAKFIKESYNSSDSETEGILTQNEKKAMDNLLETTLLDLAKNTNSFIIPESQEENENTDISIQESLGCKITIISPKKKNNNINMANNITSTVTSNIIQENFVSREITEGNLKPSTSNKYTAVILHKSDETIMSDISDLTNLPIKSTITIDTCIEDIKEIIEKIQNSKQKKNKDLVVKFKTELTSNKAEAELEKQISKDMFEKMDIIGQFNKGFIITKLDSDLFIIDQHATDEKYNFETLQQTTVLENQKLVNPKALELTAANECLLLENIEMFKKNGFTFKIDENAEPTKKVSLTAIPVSKNYQFGKEDIDELLFMLQEDSLSTMYRPSRVRAMFASRACRKSVMVGSALSKNDMRRLVDHMGHIDQPWNCPHGRPTMRHLINTALIDDGT